MNRKKILGWLGVVSIGLATIAVGPAQAVLNDCGSNAACMWKDTYFTAKRHVIGNAATWQNFTDFAFNDLASSWANRSSARDTEWYYDVNLQGDSGCMTATHNVDIMGWRDNDEASSAIIYAGLYVC